MMISEFSRVYIRRNKKRILGMEVKESKLEMDNSINKEIGSSPKDMRCASNFEDQSFHSNVEDLTEDLCGVVGEDASVKKEVEDEEVDVLGCNDNNETDVSECNDDGTDGYSSSFSGTDSEDESDEKALNDQEADSMISNDTSLPLVVRKKKVTDHWRRFVRPIMWRCKWIELKIKEFQNQAQKYDKEVEESCKAKQLALENLKPEDNGIKALPSLSVYAQRTRIRKRKKRKVVEEVSDVQSYASNHSLFSYYDSRKSLVNIPLNDNSRNLEKRNKSAKDETVFSEDTPLLEFREGDAYLEQILLKIEAAKSEARNLKNRLEKVLNENPVRCSPVNTLNLVGSADVITSSEQQKPQSVIKNEDEKTIISGEKPVKSASASASASSHHDTPEEEEETTDILLSELLASRRREGKAIIPDKKLQKTEQTPVEEGSSRSVRKRTPRNLEVKEETNPKRRQVSREKPKSNVTMASKFNRKRKRGKRRSGSAGVRKRS